MYSCQARPSSEKAWNRYSVLASICLYVSGWLLKIIGSLSRQGLNTLEIVWIRITKSKTKQLTQVNDFFCYFLNGLNSWKKKERYIVPMTKGERSPIIVRQTSRWKEHSTLCCTCLMMYIIPRHLIGYSCSYGDTHSKDQSCIKSSV